MKSIIKKLGKTSITVEKDYHSSNKEYNKLTVVEEQGSFKTYLSRKPVPVGIELTNREYWICFSGVLESITFDYLKFKRDYASGNALENNSIITRHILDRNIERIKIALKAISEEEIDNNAIIERTIKDRNVTSNKIAKENILTEHFAKKSVITAILSDYVVTAIKLADNSVTTRAIVNENVTQEKLAVDSVSEHKIVDKNVTNRKIADNTIEIEKLSSTLRETIKAATGVPGDLANDITKLMRKVFPLDVTVNITPTDLQEKGTSTEITITWSAKVEGEVVTPESVFVNGLDVTSQTSYKEIISDSKNFNIEVTAEGRVTSVIKNITYVYPIFTGFNVAIVPTETIFQGLVKQGLRTSLGTLIVTHTNDSTNKYFWICSPYNVNKVTTSGINIIGDFIKTDFTINGTTYHCYRLNKTSIADTFTFEIS